MRKVLGRTSERHAKAMLILAAMVLFSLLAATLCTSAAQAQPAYTYSAFHTDITAHNDGTLLVRSRVAYEFEHASGWVGLFIPSTYGTVVEGRVLAADGTALPQGSWEHTQDALGSTLLCDSSEAGPSAVFVFEYLLSGALELEGGRVLLFDWGAVPEDRASSIAESSFTLRFPGEVDASEVDIEVTPSSHSVRASKRFIGGEAVVVETGFLAASSSYSVSCSWPASLMETSGAGFAVQEDKGWEFERFDTEFTVNDDSSITIRETQVANFRGHFTFLNRDILAVTPVFDEGRTYGKLRIRDIAVYGLDGMPYDSDLWSVESHDWGKRVRIDFEARDERLGWVIEYRLTGALIFSQDYERLYWQAFTYDRAVPIKTSTTTVRLPEATDMSEVRTTQYVNISNPPRSYDAGRNGYVLWWRVQEIPPYSDFSIDIAFPKGVVAKPWQYERACGIAVIAVSSSLLAGVLVLMLALWWRHGRDLGKTGTTMVRYEPPLDLAPAMVGMLVNEKPSVQDISATIVDLARRGFLTIIEEEERSHIRKRRYGFQRTQESTDGLLPYEREIIAGLFASGERVSESDLRNRFYSRIDSILNRGIRGEVMDRRLFTRDPRKLRNTYLTAGALVAAMAVAALATLNTWYDLGWLAVLLLALVPVGAVIAAVGRAMPSRSVEGSRAYEHAMGFREFVQTAEGEELEYMTPENFQSNLAYAMVLGVADTWARKFKDIFTSPPQWFSSSGADFSTVLLSASLGDMTARLNSTLTSSPRASGSGGGGGFGGGSSGGGGGGGGSSAG